MLYFNELFVWLYGLKITKQIYKKYRLYAIVFLFFNYLLQPISALRLINEHGCFAFLCIATGGNKYNNIVCQKDISSAILKKVILI